MSTRRTIYLKQFCRAAGVEEGTLTIHFFGHNLSIAQLARLSDLVVDTLGREPDTWCKTSLVIKHISPDNAAHIISEIKDGISQMKRYEGGLYIDFMGSGWVKPLTILFCRKPGEEEVDA